MIKKFVPFICVALVAPLLGSCNDKNSLVSIEAVANKTNFKVDNQITKADVTVYAKYKDNSKKEINDYKFNGSSDSYTFTYNDIGEKEVSISYQYKYTSIKVNVTADPTIDKLQFIDLSSSAPYTCKVRKLTDDISGVVIIPDTYEAEGKTYSVTEIATSGFEECKKLTVVQFPKTLERIGSNAFSRCWDSRTMRGSISFKMEDCTSLKYIGSAAFDRCGCSHFELPDSVTSIGALAFYCDFMYSFKMPASLEYIGMNAFNGNYLSTITIPKNVTTIGNEAFMVCPNLREVKIDSPTVANSETNSGVGRLYEYAQNVYVNNEITLSNNSYINKSFQYSSSSDDYKIYSLREIKFTILDEESKTCSCTAGGACPSDVYIPTIAIINGSSYTVTKIQMFSDAVSVHIPSTVNYITFNAFSTDLKYAYFETSEGWSAEGTSLNKYDVANPSKAATMLNSTYRTKNWTRT